MSTCPYCLGAIGWDCQCDDPEPTNCSECYFARFVEGFDQPVGCRLNKTTFSQSEPQPAHCINFIENDEEGNWPGWQ